MATALLNIIFLFAPQVIISISNFRSADDR